MMEEQEKAVKIAQEKLELSKKKQRLFKMQQQLMCQS